MSGKREFLRAPTSLSVELQVEGETIVAQVINVSLNGVLIKYPHDVVLGTPCRVALLLTETVPVVRIEASGRFVRSDASGVAVHFDKIEGIESYWHLRTLILANADDPAEAEEEFEAHWGIRRPPS